MLEFNTNNAEMNWQHFQETKKKKKSWLRQQLCIIMQMNLDILFCLCCVGFC